MDPLSAGLFMLPSLPSKISDCTKTQFVWGEEEGAGPTLVVGGGGKKSGSDIGLIMLIPTSLHGNTSSTPSPHNLTSSCLRQKLATTEDNMHERERKGQIERLCID